ncbi:hypothetical protein ACFQYP_00130 [Nonomuraea antimicrobica]
MQPYKGSAGRYQITSGDLDQEPAWKLLLEHLRHIVLGEIRLIKAIQHPEDGLKGDPSSQGADLLRANTQLVHQAKQHLPRIGEGPAWVALKLSSCVGYPGGGAVSVGIDVL